MGCSNSMFCDRMFSLSNHNYFLSQQLGPNLNQVASLITPYTCARDKAIGFVVVVHAKIVNSLDLGVSVSHQCHQVVEMEKKQ